MQTLRKNCIIIRKGRRMAVIHFKSAKSAFAFLLIIFIASALYLSKDIGMSNSIILIAIGLLILLAVAFISGLQNTKQKEKLLDNSHGLEKLRLILRQYFLTSYIKEDSSQAFFSISLAIEPIKTLFTDFFYQALTEDPRREQFDEIAEAAALANPDGELLIEARLYGLALGILMETIAEKEEYKINSAQIKKTISPIFKNADFGEEFANTANKYLKIQKSKTAQKWIILEQITYSLLNATIKRSQNDIADPITIMPIRAAINFAKSTIKIDEKLLDTLEKHKIITD